MDSFGNLVIIALGSKDFTRLMCDFMEPCHNPMLRVPLKKNIGRMLRQVPTSKELSSYPVPPALGEKWIVTGESTLLDNIIGLYFFPTTLPKSTGWVPSFLAGQNTNYSRKKKKAAKAATYFGEQFSEWRMFPAAAYKSPLTSKDVSVMISGTFSFPTALL